MELFDCCVGNPPYQLDVQSGDASRRVTVDIYPCFQKISSGIAQKTSMIYPATWQKKPMAENGLFLRKNGLKISEYHNGSSIFSSIVNGFPISIVMTDSDMDHTDSSINDTIHRTKKYADAETSNVLINGVVRPRYEEVWIDSPVKAQLMDAVKNFKKLPAGAQNLTKLSSLEDIDFSDSAENNRVELIGTGGTTSSPVLRKNGVLSLTPDNGKVSLYIKKNKGSQSDAGVYQLHRSIMERHLLSNAYEKSWKVAIQSAPVGRMRFFNEILTKVGHLQPRVFGPNEFFSTTWILIGSFKTQEEAENFSQYAGTRFYMHLASFDFTKAGWNRFVPDLEDWTSSNKQIDWNKDLDTQLQKLFNGPKF